MWPPGLRVGLAVLLQAIAKLASKVLALMRLFAVVHVAIFLILGGLTPLDKSGG